MRYAIATSASDTVAEHFGRCDSYTLVDLHDEDQTRRQTITNPGHEPGLLPRLLNQHDVDCVVAGGAGPRAVNLFGEFGITVHLGVSGSIDGVIDDLLADDLNTGESTCEH